MDPHYANVALLLPMDEYVLGSSIADYSPAGRLLLRSGAVGLSSDQSKFGGKSCHFDGSGGLVVGSPAELAFLTTLDVDYTVESYLYITSLSNYRCIFQIGVSYPVGTPHITINVDFPTGVLTANVGGASSTFGFSSASAVPVGSWFHMALTFTASTGVFNLFIDGVNAGSTTKAAQTYSAPALGLTVGSYTSYNSFPWVGYIDELRITKGVTRYTADFTPPSAFEYAPWSITSGAPEALDGFTAYEPPALAEGVEQTYEWRDYYYGGRGSVSGSVKQKGTPSDTPVVRRVRLHQMRSGTLVAETWSTPNGDYQFKYLDTAEKYYAIAFDHLGNYRGVVADNLTPEPM